MLRCSCSCRLYAVFVALWLLAAGASASSITVDNYGINGATLAQIKTKLLDTETTASHHDIWIIEGGTNDLGYSYGNMAYTLKECVVNWLAINEYSKKIGVDIFYCELTPVASAEVDPTCPTWAPVAPKLEAINFRLAQMSAVYGFPVIKVYADLAPHWTANADAWCLNQATVHRIDGSHPNALGAEALARRMYAAIRPSLRQGKKSVAIFGDSIMATKYLPADQRIDAWIVRLAEQNSAARHNWTLYK